VIFGRLYNAIKFATGLMNTMLDLGPNRIIYRRQAGPDILDDQWIRELQNGSNIILNNIKLKINSYVGGPADPVYLKYYSLPSK
jgi:hypothetical protein